MNIDKQVLAALNRLPDKEFEKDIVLMDEIMAKHPLANLRCCIFILAALQTIGLGRNATTAACLRASADMLECPIDSVETTRAKLGLDPPLQ